MGAPSLYYLATILLLPLANSCGVLTHNQVVQRSSHIFALPNSLPQFRSPQKVFSPLLTSLENAPSIQAGAFFPDWGYQCFSTDEDAEAAHWPPFLIAAVEHITSKYGFLNGTTIAAEPRPREEQKHLESLVAFVFAVASHQTADATWHAIRLPTGLLAALAGVDFAGDMEQAHTTLDVGGDFLASARLALLPEESRRWIENSWVVPINDLAAIYERIGRPVSKPILRYCCMRGLAALRSELALGRSLFETFAAKSPMLVDEVDNYYLGGMDEMSARTVNCWANLTRWFTDGIDKDEKLGGGWGICDVFQAIKARGGDNSNSWTNSHRHGAIDNPELYKKTLAEMDRMSIATNSFGAETYTLSQLLPEIDATLPIPAKNSHFSFEDRIYVATYVPYGHLGASISVGYFHSDPDELSFAVGAPWESEDSSRPGEGNVYIVPTSYISQDSHLLRLDNIQHKFSLHSYRTLQSCDVLTQEIHPSVDQRFGTASTGLKTLNRTFLAVSAPGPLSYDPDSSPSLPFHEQVIAGRVDLFIPGQAKPEFTFTMRGAELGSIGRRQWGDHLLSAPLYPDSDDEFLIVSGSRSDGERTCDGRKRPQYGEGEVTILGFHTTSFEFRTARHSRTPFTTEQRGSIKIACSSSSGDGITYCSSSQEGSSSTGVIIDAIQLTLPEPERSRIPCDDQITYARFGTSAAFSHASKILWISAPGTGKVYGYHFSQMAPRLAVTIADEGFLERPHRTSFGHALATGTIPDGREWVAVAAPNENVDGKKQVGVVRLYLLSPEPQLVKTLVPREKRAYTKFGRTLAVDADNWVLWVGSGFAEEENGAVWAVDIAGLFARASWRGEQEMPEQAMDVSVVWCGEEAGARFGEALAVAEGNVVVGVPFAGIGSPVQSERLFGAVAVFRSSRSRSGVGEL